MRTIFQTIDPPAPRTGRWIGSVVIHVAVVACLVTIPVAFHEEVSAPPQKEAVALYEPRPLPPPLIRLRAPRQQPVVKVKPPKIAPPVKVEARIPEPPPVPPQPKAMPVPQPEAPKIEVAHLDQPKLDLPMAPAPAPKPAVHTNVFTAAAPAPAGPKEPTHVKLGGLGDPNGVPASVNSNSRSMLAKVGSFDLPEGAGNGGGGGRGRVVASAGFGDIGNGLGGNGPGGSGKGLVKNAGFGTVEAAGTSVVRASAPASPAQTPVEILSKPRPVYTAEARARRIEGEVQLEVEFRSTGQVHVMRVVRGLGMGLDESAREAASQIKFRPGTRGGVPVDMTGIVHIVFELS